MDIFLKLSVATSSCYKMQCNSDDQIMPPSACTLIVNDTMYLNPCDPDYSCQIGFETSYCIPTVEMPTALSYPGEPCKKTLDCKYGHCKYGYCQGKEEKKSCSLDAECSPGLYCKTGTCTQLLSVGQSPCITDFDCVNSAGCLSGTCVSYFSLQNGATISQCSGQVSYFCQSGTCWQNQCIEALISSNPIPTPCQDYTTCTSNITRNGMIFYSDCICGNNQYGTRYCSLFAGDDYYFLFLSSMGNWLSSEVSGLCNTVRRFDSNCIKQFWDKPNYQELMLYYFKTNYYPQIQENDDCVRDIYTSFYWNLIEDITFARMATLGIAIALVFA